MTDSIISSPRPTEDDGTLALAQYAERAYLDYAISTVRSRALPDVCDGLKPVQRRILYSMNEMGLAAGARAVKAARVVGDVLGKFHPHGDSAAYDALVRMAQDFSLRYPLIDGQGNFGSRDGDGAAAMRYTEARLTPIARLLMDEIDLGTVDFVPNYDGSGREPALLPARLPMVLLNGASGIAVALATEIPPHNLREVAAAAVLLVRQPQTTLEQLLAVLPGPDFPGGGQIITPAQDLADAYRTGRGSIKVRARYRHEELARGQWQLVIDQLPHGVSTRTVLEEIEELGNPRIKAGKKTLSADQQSLKQQLLAVVDTVRDESGKDAPVRLVIEPRTARTDRDQLLNTLLACTSLESSVPVNLVMIGIDGRPAQKSLRDILAEWAEFRVRTVERRTRHRLGKVQDRLHILEGRRLVLLDIERVIRIIRESDEPKAALIAAFALSDRQAEDILEIRLRQLARLEAIRIEQELAQLGSEQTDLQHLLGSEVALRKLVIREIEQDARTFGDDRRTLLKAAERTTLDVKVSEEPVTVIASQKGWVRTRQGHGLDSSQFTFKTGDQFYGAWPVRTTDTFYALTSTGRIGSVAVSALPSGRGDGIPLSSLVELEPGAQLAHYYAAPAQMAVLMATQQGYGLVCRAADGQSRLRAGKLFLNLSEGDQPLAPVLFPPEWLDDAAATRVVCLTAGDRPRLLVFGLDEVKVLKSGGRGVLLSSLGDGEALAQVLVCQDRLVVRGLGRLDRPMERVLGRTELESYRGRRTHKGRALEPRWKNVVLALPPVSPAPE